MNSFHARGRRPRPAVDSRPAAPRGGVRADALLSERGLADSRSAARRLIEAGRVFADGEAIRKASQELPASVRLDVVVDPQDRFVSRGGIKLDGALARTGIDVAGIRCLDIGQSTGGFTDCLLQAGAERVVGVEVGHGQLHPRLAGNPRVATLERNNARELSAQALGDVMPPGGFGLVVCDASFISLGLLLPRWPALLHTGGLVLALVKPQFEVGPTGLGKGGIVRDPARYAEVEARIRATAADAGLEVLDYFDSPITGSDGNREFFIHACRPATPDVTGNQQ
ncbi:MAG: TlyA family RNA methyltransferase [Zoogloeaceae bacterium]|nr:TlyA family RNA methyltransferase [Zoogloeaceae bacterium]